MNADVYHPTDVVPTPAPRAPHEQNDGRLKHLGGSRNDAFNTRLMNQVVLTLSIADREDDNDRTINFAAKAMAGIAPKDELEGMLAAQLVATQAAAMEGFRRAALPNQTVPGRDMNLNQANKSARTFATLLEALDRHRGKGSRQTVRVEHVHVYEGGQAIVGAVEPPGGARIDTQIPRQPHDQPSALVHAPVASLRGPEPARVPLPGAGDGERPVLPTRRPQPRRASR